jgi:hypothetical protein
MNYGYLAASNTDVTFDEEEERVLLYSDGGSSLWTPSSSSGYYVFLENDSGQLLAKAGPISFTNGVGNVSFDEFELLMGLKITGIDDGQYGDYRVYVSSSSGESNYMSYLAASNTDVTFDDDEEQVLLYSDDTLWTNSGDYYVYLVDNDSDQLVAKTGKIFFTNGSATISANDLFGGESSSNIIDINYSAVSGSMWTLGYDDRYESPSIGDNSTTKCRINFTSTADNVSIEIWLEVSSESDYDFAFISTLDNASATYDSGYYTGSKISGDQSVTVTIPVPTAGNHFIDIGYGKDVSQNDGYDCAWFKVIQ